jgi:hypothetical protein
MFEIGDYVGTVIEGPIVGERMDERGLMFKVRYEDADGFVRTRWLYPEELVEVDEGEGDDDFCEAASVTRANASLH